jgi:hypothetical protein
MALYTLPKKMSYKITEYTRSKAKKEGVVVKPSENPLKKIDVFKNGVKVASVGAIRNNGVPYMDFPNWIKKIGEKDAKKKRKAYLARHAHDRKTRRNADQWVRTPSYYADVLLW